MAATMQMCSCSEGPLLRRSTDWGNFYCGRCRRLVKEKFDQNELVLADLREILLALDLGDHARPYSPHQVVVREILPEIRSLRQAKNPKEKLSKE